uniref:U31-Eretoxin-Ek1k_1 n=1 Tax=Eresus cinnaberinus TaxID=175337 RepID=A0A2D0PCY8_ERECI
MKTFWVLVVVSALAVVSCGNGAKDPELEAVQKKLQMFELLQKFLSTLFEHGKKTEERNDCLEIGEECFMVTGKTAVENQIGAITVMNMIRPILTKYVNRCRPGSITVWLEEMYNNTGR